MKRPGKEARKVVEKCSPTVSAALFLFRPRAFWIRLAVIAILAFYLGCLFETARRHPQHLHSRHSPTIDSPKKLPPVPDKVKALQRSLFQICKINAMELHQQLGVHEVSPTHDNKEMQATLLLPNTGTKTKNPLNKCETLKVWWTSDGSKDVTCNGPSNANHCVAVVSQSTFATNQVFQWDRSQQAKDSLPQQPMLHEALVRVQLQHMLQTHSAVLEALRAQLKPKKKNKATLLLLVVGSQTQWEPFLCALAKSQLMDLPQALVVCAEATECQKLQNAWTRTLRHDSSNDNKRIQFFHHADLVPPTGRLHHHVLQTRIVHMLLHLGFNVIVMDRPSHMPTMSSIHFLENAADMVVSTTTHTHDEEERISSAPWLLDTSLFWVKSHVRTKYLWSRLVVESLAVDDDATAFSTFVSQQVWEHASLFGLRVNVVDDNRFGPISHDGDNPTTRMECNHGS